MRHACVSVCLSVSPVYLVECVCVVNKRRPTCTSLPRVSWCTYGAQGDPWLARWPGCHSTHWGNCWREFSLLFFHSLTHFLTLLLSFSLMLSVLYFLHPSHSGICQSGCYSHIVSIVTIISWQIHEKSKLSNQIILASLIPPSGPLLHSAYIISALLHP